MRRALAAIGLGKSHPTEARLSIRESLRLFSIIERHLEGQTTTTLPNNPSSLLFERLVTRQSDPTTATPTDSERSCGWTGQCFASLFFSKRQLASNHHIRHTNGSDLEQLWENPNLVLYGMLLRAGKRQRENNTTSSWWSKTVAGMNHSFLLGRCFRARASNRMDDLSISLLRTDPLEELPRVLFCNMTWVLLHNNKNDLVHSNDDEENEDDHRNVKDHQWSLIKHGNDHFQMVQGYMDVDGSDGYCLSTWQKGRHLSSSDETHSLSSRRGFTCREMTGFLSEMQGSFASSPIFCPEAHHSLFGMSLGSGGKMWPSVSFREVNDSSISGYGCRFVAEGVVDNLVREEKQEERSVLRQ